MYCKSLTCLNLSSAYSFYCNATDGFKYSSIISGSDLSVIQTNNTATTISYSTNSLAVNNNGVAVTGSNITVNGNVVLTTDTAYKNHKLIHK